MFIFHGMGIPFPDNFDLIVVGSGAAGLTAALAALDQGMRVVVVEADALIGGATALSEGMIWVPNNPDARNLEDAPSVEAEEDAALTYLRATSGNFFDQERARTYIRMAPRALAFAEKAAGLRFALNRLSRDYNPEAAGATLGRRALNPLPASMRRMDRKLFGRIRHPLGTMMVLKGLSIASQDTSDYLNFGRSPAAFARVSSQALRYAAERLAGWPRGARLANGNVIVAQLAEGIRLQGGTILTEWPVERLLMKRGRVAGVAGRLGEIHAQKGVILASGGFNASHASRAKLVGSHRHVAIPAEADIRPLDELVAETGAHLVRDVSQPVLWAPASVVPSSIDRSGPWPHFGDRAKPGVICLGPDGRRFANEAQIYHDFVPAMITATGAHPEGAHCWIITDHRALRRYGLGPIGPFPVRLGPYLRAGYLRTGRTPADLAKAMNLPPEVVQDSIARFNGFARAGKDKDFGRGESAYDRGNGDASHSPNPTLGPLEKAPYYAIRLVPGDIGSFVGLRVDSSARALDENGSAVPGLWAAGSAAAPVTGGTYPAAGLTIGQAMTFGYVAALNACHEQLEERARP
ncbi:MAG: FAD-dependent oxidoreductase [Aestuariivirga sp.]|uniref:FAD-dependent oxidoreductase n=1 Tax=Aestuariivirga sp. TaxID=2650926 RepID=UPI0025C15793|nr:FAD-dependent oxidoreductase [Aestuariivirga sp.]MCA3560066.1 FAD-dependent oxidoreductase [Aestuariivirga sp.]